jgi:hypothetical protein
MRKLQLSKMKKEEIDYAEMASHIKSFLESSEYIGFDYKSGLNLMDDRKGTIIFSVNIASSGPPTDEQTSAMLFSLLDYYNKLNEASVEFRNYTAGKKFIASLDVSSGPMDFNYATLVDGKVIKN